jgi:hypothetical protein
MKKLNLAFVVVLLSAGFLSAQEKFTGTHLNRVAFPIGGLGAGMFCLEGTGAISHVSIKNRPDMLHEPSCFAAICVLGETPEKNIARIVEGPSPDWKFFGKSGSYGGNGGTTYGFPRFRDCAFQFQFPFADIELKDAAVIPKDCVMGQRLTFGITPNRCLIFSRQWSGRFGKRSILKILTTRGGRRFVPLCRLPRLEQNSTQRTVNSAA